MSDVSYADDLPQDVPAPIETNADVSDSSAHALAERQEEQARARTNGKPKSIRDSLNGAAKAVEERTRNQTIQKALGKDLGELKPSERKSLMEYLRERPEGLSDEEKEARRDVLRELKKHEPKTDKLETSSQGEDRRREAVERAFKAHSGELNRADMTTTEQRQIRANLKARWPDRKLSDVLNVFERWHDRLRSDPTAWQQLALEYAEKTAPQNDRAAKPRSEMGAVLDYLRESDSPKSESKKISESLSRAKADADDIADMADWIKKYGAQTPELLRRADEWDRALRADPYGAAARLAANLGGMRSPQPQAQQQYQQQYLAQHQQPYDPRLTPPRSFDEHVANIQRGLDLFVQQEAPDFDHYAQDVLQILESGTLPAHLDNHSLVRLAYQTAKQRAAGTRARTQKSVSGGGSGSDRHEGPSKSIRGAIERAMGRL